MRVSLKKPDARKTFRNMNYYIIDDYNRKGIIPDINAHRRVFEQVHNVKIIVTDGNWSDLEFPSEKDYLMTVLKWSS